MAEVLTLNELPLAQRLNRTAQLAVPLVAGALAMQLTGLLDVLMIARLGNPSVAGVGLAAQLFFLLVAVALGLATAVQALVAQRMGAGLGHTVAPVLHTGLLLGGSVGLLLLALAFISMLDLLPRLLPDPRAAAAAEGYLQWRLPGLLLLVFNLTYRGYLTGISATRYVMWGVLIIAVANVVFNYLLIFGKLGLPAMGVAGAGLGSTLALGVGSVLYVIWVQRAQRGRVMQSGLLQSPALRQLLNIALPDGLRQLTFSLGVACSYGLVGAMSTDDLALFYIVVTVCLFAYLPHIGLAGAATTLVGEACGQGADADAARWGWLLVMVSVCVLFVIALPILLAPRPVLGWFAMPPDAVGLAVLPLQLILLAHVCEGSGKVLAGALAGAGAAQQAMWLSLLPQWLLLQPGLALLAWLGASLSEAAWLFLAWGLVTLLAYVIAWRLERWQSAAVSAQ